MKNSEISFASLLKKMESEHEPPEEVLDEKRAHDDPLKEGKEELSGEFIAENRERLRAVVEVDKLFDRLEAEPESEIQESIVLEIEKFLDKNEEVIAREDNSGAEEVRHYRRRLNKLREERKAA